ncbi:hypothetical protein CALCODRAFT_210449 [Calocera cornea HHB12733]|uniref:Uncharacterized protein n=1 Tax=Calocera cornea HHB12733 TaxID=1353952 RepID=A0A165HEM0_9BASI|nr:hypothetical protein CALCODRAFT_210449 [Calocera cornea HHB12733]
MYLNTHRDLVTEIEIEVTDEEPKGEKLTGAMAGFRLFAGKAIPVHGATTRPINLPPLTGVLRARTIPAPVGHRKKPRRGERGRRAHRSRRPAPSYRRWHLQTRSWQRTRRAYQSLIATSNGQHNLLPVSEHLSWMTTSSARMSTSATTTTATPTRTAPSPACTASRRSACCSAGACAGPPSPASASATRTGRRSGAGDGGLARSCGGSWLSRCSG